MLGKNCKVTRILAANGKPSKLYQDLLELSDGDHGKALEAYLMTHTKEFKDWFGDWQRDELNIKDELDTNEEPTISSYNSFVNQTTKYQKVTNNILDLYPHINNTQKEVATKLLQQEEGFKLSADDSHYVGPLGNYNRVSSVIGSPFKNLSSGFGRITRFGTDLHAVIEGIVRGDSREKIFKNSKLPVSFQEKVYNQFKKKVQDIINKGGIILPEVFVKNDLARIAGRTDMLIIWPDGSISIGDNKVSKSSTTHNEYILKTYGNVVPSKYATDPIKYGGGSVVRTKKAQHEAQLSVYKRILEDELGLTVKDMTIYPIYTSLIDIKDGFSYNNLEDIVVEPEISLSYNKDLAENLIPTVVGDRNKASQKLLESKKVIDKAMLALLEEVEKLKKATGINHSNRIEAINNIIEAVESAEEFNKINVLVNHAYKTFVKGTKGRDSINTRANQLFKNILEGKKDKKAAVRSLLEFKEFSEVFNFLDDINNSSILKENFISKAKKGTPLYKLKEALYSKNSIQEKYIKEVRPLIAEILLEDETSNEDTVSTERAQVKALEDELDKLGNPRSWVGKQKKRELSKRIDALNRYINNSVKTKDNLVKHMEYVEREISFLDRYLTPALSSSDQFVALVAKYIKRAFERARTLDKQLAPKAQKAFDDFVQGKGTFNAADLHKDFYEEYADVNGDVHAYLIQEADYRAYYKEKTRAFASFESLSSLEKAKARRKWYKENTENIPNITEYMAEKRVQLTSDEFNEWLNLNTIRDDNNIITAYIGELSRPKLNKYSSDKFKKISSNPASLAYYNMLKDTYFAAQDKLPITFRPGYRLPSVRKGRYENVQTKGVVATGKQEYREATKILEDDIDRQYSSNKYIPVRFIERLPSNEVSKDLFASVLIFSKEANRYGELAKINSEIRAIEDINQERLKVDVDSSGKPLINRIAEKSGIDKLGVKTGTNYNVEQLADFIEMQVYQRRHSEGDQKFGKKYDTLASFSSISTLGFDGVKALANALSAQVQLAIESTSNEYMSPKSWLRGSGIMTLNLPRLMTDMGKLTQSTKPGKLIEEYDAIQGDYYDNYGNRASWSALKKLGSTDTAFGMLRLGDYEAQGSAFIGVLANTEVRIGDKITNLYDAYDTANGDLILPENLEINYNGQWQKFDDKHKQRIMNTVHQMNERMFGVYSSFSRVAAKRHWAGRALLLFKNFMAATTKKRFKNYSYDQSTETFNEGYYRTFLNTLVLQTKDMLNFYLRKENTLTPLQKANLRRALGEIMAAIFLFAIAQLALGWDEEDDSWLSTVTAYEALRVKSELYFYLPVIGVPDQIKVFKNPSAMATVAERLVKTLYYATFGIGETYERKSGIWDKGDSKFVASLSKLTGISFNKLYPEESLKYLKQITY